MNPKYQKVCAEIAKTEKKIEDLQAQLKELSDKRTELENLEIINTVRAMVMDKDQVMAFLSTMKPDKPEKKHMEVTANEYDKGLSLPFRDDAFPCADVILLRVRICLCG